MSRRGRAGLPAAVLTASLLQLACSTLADPEPASICVSDEDCDTLRGEICGSGTCYASNLPARREVALDMTAAGVSGSFRLELYGPDHAVARIDTPPVRYHVSLDNDGDAAGVRDELQLSVLETYRFGDQKGDVPLKVSITASQASRLGTPQPKAVQLVLDPPVDEDGIPLEPPPTVVLPWAHYDSNDKSPFYSGAAPEPERPLLVTLSPADGLDPNLNVDVQRGIIYRQIVREQQALSGTHSFTLKTDRDCHRQVYGLARVVGVDTDAESPVPISVELVHARRDPAPGPICDPEPASGTPAVCAPTTIARVSGFKPVPCTAKNQCPQPLGCYPTDAGDDSRACGCGNDSECPTGQICELQSHRCALDLASPDLGISVPGLGLVATEFGVVTRNVTKQDTVVTEFDAWVYTYCEDALKSDREMEYVIRATPTSLDNNPAPLPPLSFHASVDFLWQNGERPQGKLNTMCFPDWEPPRTLTFDVSSPPQELYRDASDRPFVCCNPSCLDLVNPAVTPPDSCRLAATLTARTVFTPNPEVWAKHSCMELDASDPTVPAGSQRITYNFDRNACSEGSCDIALSPGRDQLEYEIRIEPADNSLIRSMVIPAQLIDKASTSLTMPKLEYRVLLRGTVTTDDCPKKPSDGSPAIDCPRASILAERLRVADDDPALGPIFLTAPTIPGSNGAFVMPVDPGVYLVTALPASGSPGGPADIRVVDLRLDSKLVDTSGPIPIADLERPLALDVGRLVTVELAGFGRSSKAVPLDVGYWAEDKPSFDGKALDLNDPNTCYGNQNRGCQIRRLRLSGSVLSLTQESYVKYLARGAPESK